jgi:hypothetical protein
MESGVVLILPIALGGLALLGLTAALLGIVALVRINRSGGELRGRGLAIGAIIIGGLMLLLMPVIVFVVFLAGNKQVVKEEMRHAEMRAKAEERAAASSSLAEAAGAISVTVSVDGEGPEGQMPVFRMKDWQSNDVAALTAKLAGMKVEGRELRVVLQGSEHCPARHVLAAEAACRKAGCTEVKTDFGPWHKSSVEAARA